MFNINFRVRDKHLADTLRLLEGKAIDLEVRPAQRATDDAPNGARLNIEALIASLGQTFTKAELLAKGVSVSGAHNALSRLQKKGLIRKVGRGKWLKKGGKK